MEHAGVRKIVFCDVDYTVLRFAHEAGVAELRKILGGRNLAEEFEGTFRLMLSGARDGGDLFAHEKKELEELSMLVVDGNPPPDPHWSRELWAYQRLGDFASVGHACEIAEVYWRGIGQGSTWYHDAEAFLTTPQRRGIEVVLVSSSDGRLLPTGEGEKFTYDPDYAAEKKWARLVASGLGHLVDLSRNLIVGDPISKPDPRFWECAYKACMVGQRDKVFIIGDSYQSDIAGAPFGAITILLDRQNRYADRGSIPLAHHVVPDLIAAMQIIRPA